MKKHSCFACGHPGTGHDPQCPVRIFELIVDHDILHGKKPFIVTGGQRAGRQTLHEAFFEGQDGRTVAMGRGVIGWGLDNLPKDKRMDYKAPLVCSPASYLQQATYAHMLHRHTVELVEGMRAHGLHVEVIGDQILVDIEGRSALRDATFGMRFGGRLAPYDFTIIDEHFALPRRRRIWDALEPGKEEPVEKPKPCRSMLSLLARAQGSKVKVQ